MGVDALLVNLAASTTLFYALLRRVQPASALGLTGLAAGFAAVCTVGGAWQLILMFD
ncbi:MAG: hypothetical protein KDC48_10905 [Planctomycetes bacterium]|nr:hypothetical protein [Planctomycetota bacterium]